MAGDIGWKDSGACCRLQILACTFFRGWNCNYELKAKNDRDCIDVKDPISSSLREFGESVDDKLSWYQTR